MRCAGVSHPASYILYFHILPKSVCTRTLDCLMHCTGQDGTELIRINFSKLRVEDAMVRPLKKLMRQICARTRTSVPGAARVSKCRRKRDVPVSQPGPLSERCPELAIIDRDIVHVRKILKRFAIALLPKNAGLRILLDTRQPTAVSKSEQIKSPVCQQVCFNN